MYSMLFILLLVSLAYGSQVHLQTNIRLAPTSISMHQKGRRDIPTTTVFFGSAENYIQLAVSNITNPSILTTDNLETDSVVPSPTSADFTLVPGAQPSGGIDVYLGPELQTKVHDASE
jgi:hypothetical protein